MDRLSRAQRTAALGAAIAVIAGVIVTIQLTVAPPAGPASPAPAAEAPTAQVPTEAPAAAGPAPTPNQSAADELLVKPTMAQGDLAPEFVGLTTWLNTPPLTLAQLRGKVVLVDFWTFACINCQRTLPYVSDWHNKYSREGLVVVGLHAPEFAFEESEPNVREAMQEQRVVWPVAMDNDHNTWRAFENRYWPRKYLIDQHGVIRYDHIGEGAYEKTELEIRKLLGEIGADVSHIAVGGVEPAAVPEHTRALFAGHGWSAGAFLGNATPGPSTGTVLFSDAASHEDGKLYLDGPWRVEREAVRYAGETTNDEASVGLRYASAEVNLAASGDASAPAVVRVTVDGQPVGADLRGADLTVDGDGNTIVRVDEYRMYNLVQSDAPSSHELRLQVSGQDLAVYTFTFGA